MNTVIIAKNSNLGENYLESIASHIETLINQGKSVEVDILESTDAVEDNSYADDWALFNELPGQ